MLLIRPMIPQGKSFPRKGDETNLHYVYRVFKKHFHVYSNGQKYGYRIPNLLALNFYDNM